MERIVCPGCQQSIRVPEEAFGVRAQCPFCKCHFRGPVRQSDGSLSAATLIMRNPFSRSRTVAPGLLLVMVGLLSVLTTAVRVAYTIADREAFDAKTRADYDGMAEQANEPWIRKFGEFTVKWLPVAQYAFLAMGLTTMTGGIAMIRRRYHSLAMVGAVLSLFNVVNCCCVLGFPAGGWALYVLMNPEVRAQFFRPKASGAP